MSYDPVFASKFTQTTESTDMYTLDKITINKVRINSGFLDSGNGSIIMQSTGIKDKNGKEIFESDYVAEEETCMSDDGKDRAGYIEKRIEPAFRYFNGKVGERRFGRRVHLVRWGEKSCGFEPFSDSENNCGHCGGGILHSKVEIVGNKFENPDLLPPS